MGFVLIVMMEALCWDLSEDYLVLEVAPFWYLWYSMKFVESFDGDLPLVELP